MRKRTFGIALVATVFALSFPVEAQQAKKVPRIGFLTQRVGIEAREEAFRKGLRELGYIERHQTR